MILATSSKVYACPLCAGNLGNGTSYRAATFFILMSLIVVGTGLALAIRHLLKNPS